ncbi:MAG: tetratricopeptide repeat protein [Acidobacteriia bacterium]|nr:tetratricopeptide repeat protein [Terriglobia bacterium]
MIRPARAAAMLLPAAALAGCATMTPRPRPPSPGARIVQGVPNRVFGTDRCGAGALSAVLNALGDPVNLETLDAELPKAPGGGVLSVDLLLAARAHGFEARLIEGSAAKVRESLEAGRPAILMLRLLDAPGTRHDVHHFVVADGVDADRGLFRVHFGDASPRWIPLDRIERGWAADGHALLLVGPGRPSAEDRLARAVELEAYGSIDDAISAYRSLVTERPSWGLAWTDLGNAEARSGQFREAEEAYRRAIAIEPEDRDALNNLAWLLLQDGSRLDEAESLARRALAAGGANEDRVRDTLDRILRRKGEISSGESRRP